MSRLLEFVRTGAIGSIRVGATRAEVQAALGPPDDWTAGKPVAWAPIWKYDELELHFDDGHVGMIFSDHIDPTLLAGITPADDVEVRHDEGRVSVCSR